MNTFRMLLSHAVALILVACLLVLGFVWYILHEFSTEGPLNARTFVDIPKGASAAKVAELLESEGAIANTFIFQYGTRFNRVSAPIRYGGYFLPPGSSMREIVDIISSQEGGGPRFHIVLKISPSLGWITVKDRNTTSGDVEEVVSFGVEDETPQLYTEIRNSSSTVTYAVTVLEGLTSWQIVRGLELAEFLDGDIKDLPEEGSLAPDTYFVEAGSSPSSLLQRMKGAQETILNEEWNQRLVDDTIATPADALILASIVEKEAQIDAERGLVASVFLNRLKKGMRLQADPTVIYGVTEGKEPLGRGLKQSELETDNPHNTYVNGGLPPTPISNPGRNSIRATLQPERTEFLYFVADGKGGHRFAKSYAEHRQNVRKWRNSSRN